ncbi:MAG: hypothetical protein IT426_14700 [Pirellulales bacterium]|nr:hypothetical protein [Pirellulales bacterium]
MSLSKRFNPVALIGLAVAVAILALLAVLPNASAQSKAILKSYAFPVERLEAAAEQIRMDFKDVAELRVSADRRNGQILVIAPAEVHAQIAAEMNRSAAQAAPAQPAPAIDAATVPVAQPPAADASGLTATNMPLRNITAREFEAKLRDILKNRLTTLPSLMPGTNRYQLASSQRGGVEFAVDFSANQVSLRGPALGVQGAGRLVRAMDTSADDQNENMRMIAYQTAKPENMKKAVDAVRLAGTGRSNAAPLAATLFAGQIQVVEPKPEEPAAAAAQPPIAPGGTPAGEPQIAPRPEAGKEGETSGLSGTVQVEMLEGLDVIVIRGKKRDIEQVAAIIEQIEKLSKITEPVILIQPLANVNCEAMAALVNQLYLDVYYQRQGTVSITPLVKPNALLLVGRKENVQTAIDLIEKLDTHVSPESEFRVFPLKHATAASVQTAVDSFYNGRANAGVGLSTRVVAIADVRSNSVVVQAGPRDMVEIAALVARLDTSTSPMVNEVQIVKLENTLASELVQILQYAFNVKGYVPQQTQTGVFGGIQQQQQTAVATPDQKSAILRFLKIDGKNKRIWESGILTDVRVTADMRANAVVVSAPAESMELLVTLIHELDRLPLAEAQIKVFTLDHGDASALMQMLQMLFTPASQQRTTGGGGGFGGFGGAFGQNQQAVVLEGGEALIPVRLAADTRTNSIIASGDASNLSIIEAILLRLDGSDIRNRKNFVYRLKNSPAPEVGQAINTYLQQVQQMQSQQGGVLSAFALVEQEVIVVPESVSNNLIVSATPRYYDDIKLMIEQIDARPPMVMIQVLLAEVTLTDNEELGVEMGLQDGILFDRSVANAAAGAAGVPGYNFIGQALGNGSIANAPLVGSQGTSNFAVGRTNSNLGFGGFTFSASSESVSVLIRALKENDRLEILSRPQVQTLDNQLALVFSGKQVPTVTGTATAAATQTTTTSQQLVGLQLQVRPRISPDNVVVMELNAQNSAIDPGAGVPITSVNGEVITAPIFDLTTAQTTVSAMDGQTVVLGGLITKTKSEIHRKVPWLGDVPYLGRLFRYDSVQNTKKELLIIMTPHVIRSEADADAVRKMETSRMNWCLADVIQLTGDNSLRQRNGEWSDKETPTVYPDLDPRAAKRPLPEVPEPIPAPDGNRNPAPSVQPPQPQNMPTNGQPPLKLQQPGGENGTMPPLPPEPALPPPANGTSAIPARPMPPGPSGPPPAVQPAGYRPPVSLPPVQPATYERPAAANSDPRNDRVAAPIYYDAPPSYPSTQATVFR